MHSRILVLNDSNYDVDKVFEEMQSYGNGVDYVNESKSDFNEDMKWFLNFASYYGIQAKTVYNEFDVVSRDAFWNRLTKEVQQIMEDDGGITPRNRFEIEYKLSMKHGFWFYLDGELFTFPYFMEYCKGKTFKVTTFLDYHH